MNSVQMSKACMKNGCCIFDQLQPSVHLLLVASDTGISATLYECYFVKNLFKTA